MTKKKMKGKKCSEYQIMEICCQLKNKALTVDLNCNISFSEFGHFH